MQQVLDVALREAEAHGGKEIHAIRLRVGVMSGVVPEALEFAFEALRGDTPARGARLVLERVPAVCYCPACNEEFGVENFVYACPRCGELSGELRAGRELEVASIEVD
jgi:hydrogenase nickel incorporation protein HypA/HybF